MGEVALVVHVLRFDAGAAAERLIEREGGEAVFGALGVDERHDLLLIVQDGCTAGGLVRFGRRVWLLRLGGRLRRRGPGRCLRAAAGEPEAVAHELPPAGGQAGAGGRRGRAQTGASGGACGERCGKNKEQRKE